MLLGGYRRVSWFWALQCGCSLLNAGDLSGLVTCSCSSAPQFDDV